jgi:predicted metal-binding protein
MSDDPIKRRRTAWEDIVLVCRKCSKKTRGGFGSGGKTRLAKALKKDLKLGKGRCAKVRVIEVGCLGLCPKNAVTVARGSQPGELLAVPKGASLDDIAATLEITPRGSPVR